MEQKTISKLNSNRCLFRISFENKITHTFSNGLFSCNNGKKATLQFLKFNFLCQKMLRTQKLSKNQLLYRLLTGFFFFKNSIQFFKRICCIYHIFFLLPILQLNLDIRKDRRSMHIESNVQTKLQSDHGEAIIIYDTSAGVSRIIFRTSTMKVNSLQKMEIKMYYKHVSTRFDTFLCVFKNYFPHS